MSMGERPNLYTYSFRSPLYETHCYKAKFELH